MRFLQRVQVGNKCWLWSGAQMSSGYGTLRDENQKMEGAHRLVWRMTYGEIPNGLQVLHHCDVKLCVRPSHLFVGTQMDNVADAYAKGRYDTRKFARNQQGEANNYAKLNARQVSEIRESYKNGVRVPELVIKYGVTRSSIYYILARKTWSKQTG